VSSCASWLLSVAIGHCRATWDGPGAAQPHPADGWHPGCAPSDPRQTAVGHDGGCANRPHPRMPRCTPPASATILRCLSTRASIFSWSVTTDGATGLESCGHSRAVRVPPGRTAAPCPLRVSKRRTAPVPSRNRDQHGLPRGREEREPSSASGQEHRLHITFPYRRTRQLAVKSGTDDRRPFAGNHPTCARGQRGHRANSTAASALM
jgi:hypothetical protein